MEYPGQPPSMAEAGFEPQTRARSNTWPCPRPEDNNNVTHSPGGCGMQGQLNHQDASELTTTPGGLLLPKKSTSRRNAWGNMSYADLITQAISSSPEKRLTLSQIYDWMVTNVPYFKDKGDSNSSAGWKNSIRHNLSLHNRFVRVQNEGTGKSSWWMLNPDAKPGKAARRRATSMETSKYEKKRGRIRKKIEAMRNGTTVLDTPSPCSSLSEGLDIFPPESPQVLHSFQLSPDFRPRASSNASSCGRLSPILQNETNVDLHDNQVPPMSPWAIDYAYSTQQQPYGSSLGSSGDRFGAEQLAGSLANTMKLSEGIFMPPPPTVSEYTSGFTLTNFQSAQSTPAGSTTGLNTTSASSDVGATGFRRIMAQDPHHYYDFIPSAPGATEKHHQQLQNVHPSELDFTLEHLGPFDCDVDEVLQTELNLGGDILVNDFNFGGGNASVTTLHNGNLGSVANTTSSLHHPTPTTSYNTGVTNAVHHQQQAAVLGRQWVH